MNKCLNCQNDTKNPKFCCRSCSAKYCNSMYPKRKKQSSKFYGSCQNCQNPIKRRSKTFCSQKCHGVYRQKQKFTEISQTGIIYPKGCFRSSVLAKEYIAQKDGNICSVCKMKPLWNSKPMILILDHINGIPDDWRIDNLRLVCPNCDSQLPTFKSKNKSGGRPYRKW